mmetsp:Transcript_25258/g.56491  ORF Transcript_25258/g.56491 Transcript_25258/m.56491 type:complete len:124 (-) Transcript_25258:19-390(-)
MQSTATSWTGAWQQQQQSIVVAAPAGVATKTTTGAWSTVLAPPCVSLERTESCVFAAIHQQTSVRAEYSKVFGPMSFGAWHATRRDATNNQTNNSIHLSNNRVLGTANQSNTENPQGTKSSKP